MEKNTMEKNDKIYVAGHKGLVGSAILRKLQTQGFQNLIYRSSKELDLRIQQEVSAFFESERPDFVFLAAAKVGGIFANSHQPAEFIYDNLAIQINIIHNAYRFGIKKLLFLGSSCVYPKFALQPIHEEYLLTGELEPTNEPYAIAKIAGIKMCQYYNRQYETHFISIMPPNLYGPNDNFHIQNAHVLASLLRKFHQAKISAASKVMVWGSGKPLREFLHVDDLADACLFLMNSYNGVEILNVGTGQEISIAGLADMIKEIVGYHGEIVFDLSKPDGTYRKLLDVARINELGWKSRINLENGIRQTYTWYLENLNHLRI
jgi:GDP-L-fucose synthase